MRIAIIGAGFAGLSSAKTLKQFGHDVTVYEKAPDVGGVWSRTRRYPGLSTQNNKGTYCLVDLPMPKHYPEWPSGAQVQEYLASYARMFDLERHVRLGTEVVSAELDESGDQPRWTVTSSCAEPEHDASDAVGPQTPRARPDVAEYDFLVVANGIFSLPFLPSWPGREQFEAAGGRVCAPSDVHELSEVAGKHVLVVGYGKSSCDIASAVAGTAASTTVVARNLLWKMPKKLGGAVNFKYLMLTRLGEALFEYRKPTPAERFLHGPGRPVRDTMIKSLQGVATKQLALHKMDLVPAGSFDRIARSTVSLTSDGFYAKARSGQLSVRRDCQISRLVAGPDGRCSAELSDGSTVACDVVIAATGWRQEVPFLSAELQDRLTDERGNYELYRFILPHEVPGLAFAGYNSSFFSPLSAEMAALWIANYLMGEAVMPPLEERRRLVAERLAWMEERTEGKHARGTNIIPFSMHNIDESLAGMGLRVPPAQRLREWLLPVNPQDYRFVNEALLRRKAGVK